MEHILQFAVSIDDKAIEERAYNKAVELFMSELKGRIYTGGYYSTYNETAMNAIKKEVDRYKDEIIELAAKKLAESIKRSKAWEKKFGEIIEEAEE